MNDFCVGILSLLVRNALVLTLTGPGVLLIQRYVTIRSPQLRRFLWFAVILQGCLLIRIPVSTTWFTSFVGSTSQRSVDSASSSNLSGFAAELAKAILTIETDSLTTHDPSQHSSTRYPWAELIAFLWITGMVAITFRAIGQYWRFIRSLPLATQVPEEWLHELNSLACPSRCQVTLRPTENLGPLLCWHPAGYQLVVPTEVWRLLESRQRLMILRHELAHLERGDLWKSLALRLLALPHWFNPMVWWIVNRFDDDAECACDDAIHQAGPDSVIDYARTLLLLGGSHNSTFLTAQAKGGHGLADRIRRLIVPNSRKDSNMKKLAIVIVAVGISTLPLLRFQSLADDQVTTPSAPAKSGETIESRIKSGLSDYDAEILVPVNLGNDATFLIGLSDPTTVATAANQNTQAVIDLAFLFQNLLELAHERGTLKALRTEYEEICHREIEAKEKNPSADISKLVEQRIAGAQSLHKKESAINHAICQKVKAEVMNYAKQNGIRLVRNRKIQTAPALGQLLLTTVNGRNLTISPATTVTGGAELNINFSGNVPSDPNKTGAPNAAGDWIVTKPAPAGETNESGQSTRVTATSLHLTCQNGVNFWTETANEFTQMLQKEVLFVEAADEVDITSSILESLNTKYRQEHPND